MRAILLTLAALLFAPTAIAAEFNVAGTYKLLGATRQVVDTGEQFPAFGKNPKGLLIYDKSGNFNVVIMHGGRPKQTSADIPDDQRAILQKTMVAYGGTYTFTGDKIEHHVDFSWNDVWAGTTVTRQVKRDGNRLSYLTAPAFNAIDRKMNVTTIMWEKIAE